MEKNRQTFDVQTHNLNELGNYTFVAIFARYNSQWIFRRHKERDTYEVPSGHIEQDESLIEAAKRKLYEGTGATKFEIKAMFDYLVDSSFGLSNGQVFLADIQELDVLPTISKTAEIMMFDDLPQKLTCPEVQPILFKRVAQEVPCLHNMRLNPLPFDKIKSGEKIIEIRLYDEKRKRIKIGDRIAFTKATSNERIVVEVVNLHRFATFRELYQKFSPDICGSSYDSIEDRLTDTFKDYYTKEQELEFGVLAIEIRYK